MSDETDKQIKDRLNSIFPSPEVAAKVVDLVVPGNKPRGWGHRSNAPYFKEIYARQLKTEIDKMLESGERIVYRYSTWCTNGDMSRLTLYNRINQSIRYLVERMDTADRRYSQWYETVTVKRHPEIGVIIAFIPGLRGSDTSGFKPEYAQPRENMPKWKQQMEDYLESDNTRPFVVEGLALTPDEIVAFKNQFALLDNVMVSITSSTIKIIRTS